MGFNYSDYYYNFGNPWTFSPFNKFNFNYNTGTPFSPLPFPTPFPWQHNWFLQNNPPTHFNFHVNHPLNLNYFPVSEILEHQAQIAEQVNDISINTLPSQVPELSESLQQKKSNLPDSQSISLQNQLDPTLWKTYLEQAYPNFKVPEIEDDSTIIDLNPIPNQTILGMLNIKRALENQGIDTSAMICKKELFLLEDLQESQKKFGKLTQEESSRAEESSSTSNDNDQMSAFERGQHDEDQIASFIKNQLKYPEGSPERYTSEYLKSNLLGHGKGIGARLAYFSGSLAKKIENGLDKIKQGCQVIGSFLDPCSGESFNYVTNGAGDLLKEEPLPNQIKDSLEILALSDHQSLGMQAAIQNGANLEDVSQEALSYIYRSGLTGQPELHLGIWDKHLQKKQKGLAQKIFKTGSDLVSLAHSMFLHTGSSALDEILDFEERAQLAKQFTEDVHSAGLNRELTIEKMTDASLKQVKEISSHIAHEVFDRFAEFQSQLIKEENYLEGLFSSFLPTNLLNDLNLLNYEQQKVFAADFHQKIDTFFSTNQAVKYSPEFKTDQALTLGITPSPYDLIGSLRLPPTLINNMNGWKVGLPFNNRTIIGNAPTWNTVRQRHWKNKAYLHKNGVKFEELVYEPSPQNIKRMEKGLAPQIKDSFTGKVESIELHHDPSQKLGGLFNFIEVTPEQHARLDPNRFIRR